MKFRNNGKIKNEIKIIYLKFYIQYFIKKRINVIN